MTKPFKKAIIFLVLVIIAIGIYFYSPVKTVAAGDARLRKNDQIYLDGQTYLFAVCDTGNGTMIYALRAGGYSDSGFIAVVQNGCDKK